MVITFTHPIARNYLLKHGEVYTFRVHKRKRTGNNWAAKGRGKPKLVDVHITLVKIVERLPELEPYVRQSGFASFEDWINAIDVLNPRFAKSNSADEPWGFLYHVKIRKKVEA